MNLCQIDYLIKSIPSLKLGQVGSKTRLPSQMLEKNIVCTMESLIKSS